MKLGDVTLKNNIFLAPMAGVTDMPFRILCQEQGAGLVYSEMISAKGISYENANTKKLMTISESEKPIALQLFGRDPILLSEIVKKTNSLDFAIIDINMGCPAGKIIRNNEGSALLKEPLLIGKIINAVYKATKKPVTIKIRTGINDDTINALEVAKIAEQNGVSAITIHGRTQQQLYKGKADWDIIRQVKQSVSVPIIGNGDIFTPEDAKRIINQTNCDGIMIGRASQGNPFIFKQIVHYLKTGVLLEPPRFEDKINTAIRHIKMITDFKGEFIAVREMRKHISHYIKNIEYSARIREQINKVETQEELIEILLSFAFDVKYKS